MGKHHSLGGSNTYTWLNCPGSRNAINAAIKAGLIPEESPGNQYTEEGTIAHGLGEICLTYGFEVEDFYNKTIPAVIGKSRFKKFFNIHEFNFLNPETEIMTSDYIEAVEIYVNYIREKSESMEGSELLLEESYSLEDYVKDECGGSADATVLGIKGLAVVGDYKHGKGVTVEAKENPQTRLYGLGMVLKHEKKYRIREVELAIIQPRVHHIDGPVRKEILSVQELKRWGRKVVKPAVRALQADNPDLIPGEKQCLWCRINGHCKANAEHALMIAQKDFAEIDLPDDELIEPNKLTIEEAEVIVKNKKRMEKWLNAVEHYLEQAVESGTVKSDEFKLVERISNRQYKREKAIVRRLKRKYPELELYEHKIKSPAQMELALKTQYGLKAKEAKEIVDAFCERVKIGVALAPLTDGREEIAPPAKTDFENHIGGEEDAKNFYK